MVRLEGRTTHPQPSSPGLSRGPSVASVPTDAKLDPRHEAGDDGRGVGTTAKGDVRSESVPPHPSPNTRAKIVSTCLKW